MSSRLETTLEVIIRLVVGLNCLMFGLMIIYHAVDGAPHLSAFFGRPHTADGRDAAVCMWLIMVGLGCCYLGFLSLPD